MDKTTTTVTANSMNFLGRIVSQQTSLTPAIDKSCFDAETIDHKKVYDHHVYPFWSVGDVDHFIGGRYE